MEYKRKNINKNFEKIQIKIEDFRFKYNLEYANEYFISAKSIDQEISILLIESSELNEHEKILNYDYLTSFDSKIKIKL